MTVQPKEPSAEAPTNFIAETEQLCRDVAKELITAIGEVRKGNLGQVKDASIAIRELRAAFQMAMEERTRVERQRKEDAGIVNHYALDLDAARSEIERRLARLRDAGRD